MPMREHRITDFKTTPIGNFVGPEDAWVVQEYSRWHSRSNFLLWEASVPVGKRILGRQDYCWSGSYRYWIWQGEVDVQIDGQAVPYRWRLFASTRGFSFEVEAKDHLRTAIPQVWKAFTKLWETKAQENPMPAKLKTGESIQMIGRAPYVLERPGSYWEVVMPNGAVDVIHDQLIEGSIPPLGA